MFASMLCWATLIALAACVALVMRGCVRVCRLMEMRRVIRQSLDSHTSDVVILSLPPLTTIMPRPSVESLYRRGGAMLWWEVCFVALSCTLTAVAVALLLCLTVWLPPSAA